MKKVTLAEVASKAGVSSATVSRYLKQENVRPEIAERIEAAIQETGYTVKKNTSDTSENKEGEVKDVKASFKKNKAKFLILTTSLENIRTRSIVQALQKEIYAQDGTFQLCVSDGRSELEEMYLTSGIVSNVDGIIVESCSQIAFIKKQMRTTSIPVVYLQGDEDLSVAIDEIAAGHMIGSYLLTKQHLVIRYLSIQEDTANAHIQGIKDAYHEQKQPFDLVRVESAPGYMAMYEKIKEAFAQRIDVLLLQNEDMIIPVAKYIQEYHIAVPQNFSIISFGGGEISRMTSPVLTSLAYDYDVYAKDILQVMSSSMNKKAIPKRSEMFQLQEGDSVR